jgi:hypothetical protein
MIRIAAFLIVTLLAATGLQGQEGFGHWLQEKEGAKIQPFMQLQLWSSYSMGQEVYNPDSARYDPVEDRLNIMLRRMRLGFRAEPYEGLRFMVMGAYDLIGQDVMAAHIGTPNNGGLPRFGIWDAFFQWQLQPGKEYFHLTGGYFRPQFSRESITSGWAVPSMEKAMSQTYIRKHLTGIGPGRAAGLNLGGLLLDESRQLGLNYNLGIFNPLAIAEGGNSTGQEFSPLFVARGVVSIGQPEMEAYRISYDLNYYGRRKGVSLGFGGAWQGRTARFDESYAFNTDLLFNWGPLNLDADWVWMWREGQRKMPDDIRRSFVAATQAGHVRLSYNLVAGEKYFLEPVFMLMHFAGARTLEEQADARAVGASSGAEYTYDLGLNWHLNQRKLKLLLHYTWHAGEAGEAEPGFASNAYFNQNGLGPIRRGNWVGLGLNVIL